MALPIEVLVIQPHELVGFVRGVTGPVRLQFHPRIAWDLSHEVFRFIFITADKSDVHGKVGIGTATHPRRITREEGYNKTRRRYSKFIQFGRIEPQVGRAQAVRAGHLSPAGGGCGWLVDPVGGAGVVESVKCV